MIPRTRYYAEFMSSGSEQNVIRQIIPCECRDPLRIEVSDEFAGFRLLQRTEATTDTGELLKGEFRDPSHWYFIGKIKTFVDVINEQGTNSVLYKNMQDNKWDAVVEAQNGRVFPLEHGDVVLRERS